MELRVVVRNLVKRYRRFVLEVSYAEFVKGLNVVLGANGSGKTTLLKVLAGCARPNGGSVEFYIDGKRVGLSEARKVMVFIGDFIQLPNARVKELLEVFARSRRDVKRVAELLELEPHLDKHYDELSAGFRKRVQIAIALLRDPRIVLLDEPFANVDALMIPKLKSIIEDLCRDRLVIITTHVEIFAEMSIERVLVLDQGKVLFYGDGKELVERMFLVDVDGKKLSLQDLAESLGVSRIRILKRGLVEVLREGSSESRRV